MSKRATTAYFFFFIYLFLLYARPMDYYPPIQKYSLAMPFALVACLAFGFSFLRTQMSLIWSRELFLMFALTAWIAAGIPFSAWRSNSFDFLTTEWIKVIAFFLLMSQVVCTMERIRKVLWLIIFSLFMTSALTIALKSGSAMQMGYRMIGFTLGVFRGNFLGIAVGIILPYMAAFLLEKKKIWRPIFLVVTFLLANWYIIMSASRSNLIIEVFTLLVVWFTMFRKNFKANLLFVLMAIALVGSILAAPATFWQRVGTLWGSSAAQGSEMAESAEESAQSRRQLLMRSIEFTIDKPIFGVGIRNFSVVSGTVGGESGDWKGTHNTYTELSSETGIPGLLIALAMMVTCFRRMRRIQKEFANVPQAHELVQLCRATEVSILAMALSGMFAHFAFEYLPYQVLVIGLALQTVATKMRAQLADGTLQPAEAPQRKEVIGRRW